MHNFKRIKNGVTERSQGVLQGGIVGGTEAKDCSWTNKEERSVSSYD